MINNVTETNNNLSLSKLGIDLIDAVAFVAPSFIAGVKIGKSSSSKHDFFITTALFGYTELVTNYHATVTKIISDYTKKIIDTLPIAFTFCTNFMNILQPAMESKVLSPMGFKAIGKAYTMASSIALVMGVTKFNKITMNDENLKGELESCKFYAVEFPADIIRYSIYPADVIGFTGFAKASFAGGVGYASRVIIKDHVLNSTNISVSKVAGEFMLGSLNLFEYAVFDKLTAFPTVKHIPTAWENIYNYCPLLLMGVASFGIEGLETVLKERVTANETIVKAGDKYIADTYALVHYLQNNTGNEEL